MICVATWIIILYAQLIPQSCGKALDVNVGVRPAMAQILARWSTTASMQEYRCKPKTSYSASTVMGAIHISFTHAITSHTTYSPPTRACVKSYFIPQLARTPSNQAPPHHLPDSTSFRGRTPVDHHHQLPHGICPLRPPTHKGQITDTTISPFAQCSHAMIHHLAVLTSRWDPL